MGRASLLVSVLVALCGVAHAGDKTKAREAYVSGSSHYDLREFREALTDFKEAYRQLPEPTFLFNIAQCHRQLGDTDDAIKFFRTYLNKLPNAPNRVEVAAMIDRLEKEKAAAAAAAPTQPVTPAPVPEPAPAPATPAVAPTPIAQPAAVVVETPAPVQHQPVYKKWWLWTTVGVVVVAAGLGIGLGIGLTQSHTPSASTEGGTFKPNFGSAQ